MSMNPPDPAAQDQPAGPETMALERTPGEPRPEELNLADEFREFGRELTALLHVLRESPRAKEVENQMTQAMREMERQVNEAMVTAREQTRDWKGTIRGAATTAADETGRGLARGLHALNERMAQAVQEAEKNRTPPGGAAPGATGGEGGPA